MRKRVQKLKNASTACSKQREKIVINWIRNATILIPPVGSVPPWTKQHWQSAQKCSKNKSHLRNVGNCYKRENHNVILHVSKKSQERQLKLRFRGCMKIPVIVPDVQPQDYFKMMTMTKMSAKILVNAQNVEQNWMTMDVPSKKMTRRI